MRNTLSIFIVLALGCSPPGGDPATDRTDPPTEVAEREPAAESPDRSTNRELSSERGKGNVTITRPQAEAVFDGNPIEISGTARTFENNVVLEIFDENEALIRRTSTTARGDLGEFNPWSTELWVTRWPGRSLTVRAVEYSARDGSLSSSDSIELENGSEPIEAELWFPPAAQGNDCSVVKAVSRKMPKGPAMARLLVEALLGGPTEEERAAGVTEATVHGGRVDSITAREGTVTVDFSPEMQNVGGSCRALAIRASIEKTLLQLPTVARVRIMAGGSEALALQP